MTSSGHPPCEYPRLDQNFPEDIVLLGNLNHPAVLAENILDHLCPGFDILAVFHHEQ
jgi:hypothetical protein